MIVFLLLVVVLLIGLTAAAVMGRIGGFMAEPTSSLAFPGLPDRQVSADDVEKLRFDTALRGYRMSQVDEVVDALGARLRELESELAQLANRDGIHGVSPGVSQGLRDIVRSDPQHE